MFEHQGSKLGKGEIGLDHYQVRRDQPWYRQVTLSMASGPSSTQSLAATPWTRSLPGGYNASQVVGCPVAAPTCAAISVTIPSASASGMPSTMTCHPGASHEKPTWPSATAMR